MEAMKAMAAVAPQFGLVPLKEMTSALRTQWPSLKSFKHYFNMLLHTVQQGRNFREAMKAMAAVAPQFGLVSLKKWHAQRPQWSSTLSIVCHVDTSVNVFC